MGNFHMKGIAARTAYPSPYSHLPTPKSPKRNTADKDLPSIRLRTIRANDPYLLASVACTVMRRDGDKWRIATVSSSPESADTVERSGRMELPGHPEPLPQSPLPTLAIAQPPLRG